MEKSIKKYWPLFLLPTLAAFAIGFIFPFLWGIFLSFHKFTTISKTTFVGLDNYIKVFQDSTFTSAFWFTAKFTIVSTILINIIAFAIALALTRGLKGTNIFRTVFFLPNLIGGIVLGYIWQILQALFKVKLPMVMPSITICSFLTLTNSFKLFDQNLSLTAGEPAKASQMLALNIYDTFYQRSGAQWKGIGQAKAVVFFLLVIVIALIQLYFTRRKEVQQ